MHCNMRAELHTFPSGSSLSFLSFSLELDVGGDFLVDALAFGGISISRNSSYIMAMNRMNIGA